MCMWRCAISANSAAVYRPQHSTNSFDGRVQDTVDSRAFLDAAASDQENTELRELATAMLAALETEQQTAAATEQARQNAVRDERKRKCRDRVVLCIFLLLLVLSGF